MCFASCKIDRDRTISAVTGEVVPVRYAKGFSIIKYENYKKVVVRNPLDTNVLIAEYYLIDHDVTMAPELSGKIIIRTPINDLACLSTTHLAFLNALNRIDKLIAFSGTRYVYDKNISAMVEAKKIKEAGEEGALNYELLISLKPDIVMAYNMGNPEYDHFSKLLTFNLTSVINNEYLELTPLGQAEWIKYVAVFFNEEAKAAKIFDTIAAGYNLIKNDVASMQSKPTVFTAIAFKGEWAIPGGKSFAATYLKDAGAHYVWADNNNTGNFPVSFEQVLHKAKDADYWLNPGGANSLHQIKQVDTRYSVFNAYNKKNVFNNNKRVSRGDGNDYWESGIVNPHILLKDLVAIFHPELYPQHKLVYYQQLQ